MNQDLWSTLPKCLQDQIIAQTIESDSASATSLLLSNKRLNHSTCKSLYQELYILDDEDCFDFPLPNTRVATVLANLNKYARFVRMVTLVPRPTSKQSSLNKIESDLDSPFSHCYRQTGLTPLQIGKMFASFPNLEAFVWASDRVPPPQFCELISILGPKLEAIFVRPAFPDIVLKGEHRWSAIEAVKLNKLKMLSISHLSGDGIRRITAMLEIANSLTHLTIDSQFADDNLLRAMGEMKALTHVILRCSGTKVTDKGIAALLENSQSLKSLKLDELEGRLSKNVWQNIEYLPDSFEHFKIAYAEEGPHHSWVTDHLDGIFNLFSLAQTPLKTFSITTLVPECMYVRVQESETSSGSFQIKRTYQNACDERILPRKLPAGALEKILNHGKDLEVLELDMFEIILEEVKKIMYACRSLKHLRIRLDSPLSKFLGLSSSFVQMTKLEKLSVSLTEIHCPLPGIVQVNTEEKGASHSRSNSNTNGVSKSPELPNMSLMPGEISPASTHASLPSVFIDQELSNAENKSPKVTRSISNGNGKGLLIINTSLGWQIDKLGCKNDLISNTNVTDASIPPKREIRKLARRCPTLRTINWYGRLGKGEWSIIPAATTLQTGIIFTPIYMIEDRDRDECMELETGADVEKFIVSRRIVNLTDLNDKQKVTRVQEEKVDVIAELERKLALVPQSLLDDIEFPSIETGTARAGSSSPVSLHACSSRDTSATLASSPTLSNKSPKMLIRYAMGLPTSHTYCNFTNPWIKDENRFSFNEQKTYAEATNKVNENVLTDRENVSIRARSSSQVVESRSNRAASFGKEVQQESGRKSVPLTTKMGKEQEGTKITNKLMNNTSRHGSTLPKKPVLSTARRASERSN